MAVYVAGVEPEATATLAGSTNSAPEPNTMRGGPMMEVGDGMSTTQAPLLKVALGVAKLLL